MLHRTLSVTLCALFLATPARADDVDDAADLPRGFAADMEIGAVVRHLHTAMTPSDLGKARPYLSRTTGPAQPAGLDTAGMRLYLAFGSAQGLFVGCDGDALAALDGPTIEAMTPTGMGIQGAPSMTILMHALAGWRQFAGRALLSGELAVGGGITGYAVTCTDPGCNTRFHDPGELVGDVEARARLGYFVTPIALVDASFGASLIDRGAYSVAVMVGLVPDARHARRRPR